MPNADGAGYYRYDQGFTPRFDGIENFQGQVIHPQHWPENLNYRGKRVVVIGSGATAVTLIPSMAKEAQHVTMLQRTPTYVMSLPSRDPIANLARKLMSPAKAYAFARRKNIGLQRGIWRFCQKYPNAARRIIRYVNKVSLPKDYPVDVHFNPPYSPWEQRLCAVPDGDLFKSIKAGKASVVTDHIDTFTAGGIRLKSGLELPADIIVTATGLNLRLFGGMQISVDGQAIQMNQHISYKGLMFSDIPNFSNALGYTNASWTLKADLIAEYVCRLLKHMDKTGTRIAVPVRSPDVQPAPLLDMSSGYVARAEAYLPKGADRAPWKLFQNYAADKKLTPRTPADCQN